MTFSKIDDEEENCDGFDRKRIHTHGFRVVGEEKSAEQGF